ncbi:MAG TPA: 50S ribosomal protein L31 [Candidatus Moranbacteria bacterium]|nr:50S ribosomal protein L31 [Candidatus Moranbacteria bacterium]
MKKGIHPEYFSDATVTCSCGAVLSTGATIKSMHVEICSQCHPFYTGKKKVVDTTGRVDRFKKLAEKTAKAQKVAKEAAKAKKGSAAKKEIKAAKEKEEAK